MSEQLLPPPGTLVELTVADEPLTGVRVIAAGTLSLAPALAPPVGTTVTLRWPAGPRGRYVLMATVAAVEESRVEVTPVGQAEIEQHRNYVRGGGGEQAILRRPGSVDAAGWIRDISEQGIRAHFADVTLTAGDEIRLTVQLTDEVLELTAVATKVDSLRQRLPQRGPMSVEVVATLAPDEAQAQAIRRYVLRQQLLARARP